MYGDVQKALEALERAYHSKGYGTVSVFVPEQELASAVVRLQVAKGIIGKVTVTGNKYFSTDNVRNALAQLQEGKAPNLSVICDNVQFANENPAKKTGVTLGSSEEEGKVDAKVAVSDENPHRVYVTVDNAGEKPKTGQYRTGVGKVGSLPLDPDNINIVTTAAGTFGTTYGGDPWVFTASGGSDDSVIGWDTFDSQLGLAQVYISSPDGNINILARHAYSSGNDLYLVAGGNINATNVAVYNTYGGPSGGEIRLLAGWDAVSFGGVPSLTFIPGTGDITLTDSLIKSTSDRVYLAAGRDIKLDSASSVISDRVRIRAGRNAIIDAHLEALGSEVRIDAGFNNSYGGSIALGAGSSIVAPARIRLRARSGPAGSGDITQAAGATIDIGAGGDDSSHSSRMRADGNLLLVTRVLHRTRLSESATCPTPLLDTSLLSRPEMPVLA